MFTKINRDYLILFFAGLCLIVLMFQFFYQKFFAKKYIRIDENNVEIIVRKSRGIRFIRLVFGIIGSMGVLFLFLIPLILSRPSQLDGHYVVLLMIIAAGFVMFVTGTIRGFITGRDMRIRKQGEDVFVNDAFFAKLAEVRVITIQHITTSAGFGPSYYIKLSKGGRTGLRLANGVASDEAQECKNRLNAFFAGR